MAKVKDCPGFETFGKDVKNARLEMRISRQKLAETLICFFQRMEWDVGSDCAVYKSQDL